MTIRNKPTGKTKSKENKRIQTYKQNEKRKEKAVESTENVKELALKMKGREIKQNS